MTNRIRSRTAALLLAATVAIEGASPAAAEDRQALDRSATETLASLTKSNSAAKL